ncbi:MAG: hypothetical protein IJK89_04530 [Clostridia bacterium]|nr:hypothetical protein [Clostridia bacterium]
MKTIYRILAPIMSLAVFPVLYFLPLIRAMVSSGLLGALTGNTGGTKTNLLTSTLGLGEYTSIKDIVKLSQGDTTTLQAWKSVFDNLGDDFKDRITKEFACGRWLIAALVFFALLVLLTLVFTVLSAVMSKHVVPLCLAGGAFVSALLMNVCFNNFAKPFVTGAINLSSILGNNGGENSAILGALLGNAVTVDYLQLSVAYTVTLFILVVIMVLTLCALVEEKFSKD